MMRTLYDNSNSSNKHKVAFYVVLVILSVTLQHCHSHRIDATEVISQSSQDLPKIINTSVGATRGYGAEKSVPEKLKEIRELLRSLIFDWNLGESGVEARTFGRIRMMRNILLPAAFLGGFLLAVILGIKIIGLVNMFLISSLLALNFAVLVGKLLYAKKAALPQNHYHSHYSPYASHYPSYSSSYGYADSRADINLPFGRNMKFGPPTGPQFPQNIPPTAPFQSQFPQNFNQPNNLQQYPQPANFQPQMNVIPQPNSNPFSGIQMQAPQQVQYNQPQQQQLTTPNTFAQQPLQNDVSSLINSNDIQQSLTTTPAFEVQQVNLQEIKPVSSMSPVEMEKILTDALARISESRQINSPTTMTRLRFKRKLTDHRPYVNLLRPFS